MPDPGDKGIYRDTVDYWKGWWRDASNRTRDMVRETRDGLNRLVKGPPDGGN